MLDYSTCPYKNAEPLQRWDQSVSSIDKKEIDPGIIGKVVNINQNTKVASAGSCFAQRISQTIRSVGYNFYDAEPPPSWLHQDKYEDYGYGIYSARYGNVYTARQLLQLLERSFGIIDLADDIWVQQDRFMDPFRPRITPNGYSSKAELTADRNNHLLSVKRMFEEIDIFVFTLGLTEAWIRNKDNAVLPICPGCGVGQYDQSLYSFKNFEVQEIIDDLRKFVQLLTSINDKINIILTVSPVSLAATMEPHSVILSSSYSKSVLRVAAQSIVSSNINVSYFPSYEIITQTFNNEDYFSNDRRNITPLGVSHVMKCFFRHFAGVELGDMPVVSQIVSSVEKKRIICDEEELAQALASRHINNKE